MIKKVIETGVGILFLALLVEAIDGLVHAFALPIPAPIIALGLLTLFLWRHGRVPEFLDQGITLLVRLFPLLFIPPLVALHHQADTIASYWLALLLVVSVSTGLGLLVSAWLFRLCQKRAGAAK